MFYTANVATTTIGKIIQSLEFQEPLKIIFDYVLQVKTPEHLYINIDETFLKLRVKGKMKKYRIRLVTYHTGYDKFWSTSKQKVLANKSV